MSVSDSRKALLLGATGLVGSQLLNLMLQDSTYSLIRILVRKPVSAQHSKLEQIAVDFDNLAAYAYAFVVDDVFCCLGTTIKKAGSQEAFYKVDAVYPFEAAKLAKQKGASQFLLITAMGSDKHSAIFYNRVKGEVEEKISNLQLKAFHMLRPSLLLGDRHEKRTGEQIGQAVMSKLGFLMVGPLKKYKAIEASRVAQAMLFIAKQNQPGKHVYTSDQLQTIGKGHG